MRRAFFWLSALVTAGILFTGAIAWSETRPVSAQSNIAFPDGSRGLMLLVRSDGVISDPIRVVLVDAKRNVLARSNGTRNLTLLCNPTRGTCKGFDRDSFKILRPVPTLFRYDTQVAFDIQRFSQDDLWELGEGASWGFEERTASASDILLGLGSELIELPGLMIAVAIAVPTFIGLSLQFPRRMDRRRFYFKIAALIIVLLRLISLVAATFVAVLGFILIGAGLTVILFGIACGIGAAKALRHLTDPAVPPVRHAGN